ncbi:putative methanogenesis marker 16 metalloprotein [Methanolinea mesophila]|uniref:methanogenesis marker 16 metalloprotein n=1 Tax=Methanolinea mesophila TaxID=547055 RepID=UPI001AE60C09|nr:putative methanogenesis marker 16 metalloprotein [Methanolinea mesophila]
MKKTIEEINDRITRGDAVVYTAAELKDLTGRGERISAKDVDVVTTGTFGVMSGTIAVLHVPVSGPGSFDRAERAWLNGVPAIPGPCPNERLGSVDLVIYGTSRADNSYGGGHLFRDLVAGSLVDVEIEAGGKRFSRSITLREMGSARIITTRSAFKNYGAYLNPRPGVVNTIFSVRGLSGPSGEISVSGCGDINPLQNDPNLSTIGVGTRILLNGGAGYIMGQGTRSSRDKPNIAAFCEMHRMIPEMMGGFVTSSGPECTSSVAIPIPVLDDAILTRLRVTNEEIPLPVSDINNRVPVAASHYGEVWNGTDLTVTYTEGSCIRCETCEAAGYCPTGAILPGTGIDPGLCVNCGTCVGVCPGGAFHGELGNLNVGHRTVPVTLRQSDRARALRLCEYLKTLILEGEFQVTGKLEDM